MKVGVLSGCGLAGKKIGPTFVTVYLKFHLFVLFSILLPSHCGQRYFVNLFHISLLTPAGVNAIIVSTAFVFAGAM